MNTLQKSIVALILSFGTFASAEIASLQRGDIITSSEVKHLTLAEITKLKNAVPGGAMLAVKSGVTFYKLSYETIDARSKLTEASGLLAVPDSAEGPLPVVSYQHGTVFSRDDVPSRLNDESTMISVLFSANGYATVLADYLGLGDSKLIHPYVHSKTEASASVDMLIAAKKLLATKGRPSNGQLFLVGYSQGGHATMALHKEIEEHYPQLEPVTASAPCAGPYSMSEATVQGAITNPSPATSAFVAYLYRGYRSIYGLPSFTAAFKAPYGEVASKLFDSDLAISEMLGKLPAKPTDMLAAKLVSDLEANKPVPFYRALKANDLYDWLPKAPVKLFHGDHDNYVPSINSQIAYDHMKAKGANITLVWIKGANHPQAVLPSLLGARFWFDSFKKK